jgi:hypothetical protein
MSLDILLSDTRDDLKSVCFSAAVHFSMQLEFGPSLWPCPPCSRENLTIYPEDVSAPHDEPSFDIDGH